MVYFPRRLVFFGKYAFYFTDVHINSAVAFPLVITDYYFSFFILEFGIKTVFLYIPDCLVGFLLRALHRYAIKLFWIDLYQYFISGFRVRI